MGLVLINLSSQGRLNRLGRKPALPDIQIRDFNELTDIIISLSESWWVGGAPVGYL